MLLEKRKKKSEGAARKRRKLIIYPPASGTFSCFFHTVSMEVVGKIGEKWGKKLNYSWKFDIATVTRRLKAHDKIWKKNLGLEFFFLENGDFVHHFG